MTAVQPLARTTRRRLRPAFTLLEVLVVVAILLILAGVSTFAATAYLARAKVSEARLKMKTVENAAKTYMTNNDSTPPDNLNVLVQSTDGKPPLLEGGQAAITDPWGKPFQIKMMTDSFGSPRIVIHTTDESGNYISSPDEKKG